MELANFRGELLKQEPLSRHTSYHIGGPADLFASPADVEDLAALIRACRDQAVPFFVIGGGTNLLVRDKGFRGAAISLQRMRGIRTLRQFRSVGGSFVVVAAEAGASLGRLVGFSQDEGLTGLEFSTGIPGTIGGAICMNAGTAEGEIGNIVESVLLLSPDGELVIRSRDEMGFGYRQSDVPTGYTIVEARVALRRGDRERIKAQVAELMAARKERQPWGVPNAGSVFKNPHGQSAGRLIDLAKLKGRRVGGAQVSEKHANFIVNTGGATAADVLALMKIVQRTVLEVHGVRLEPEIRIVGEE